MIKDIAKWLVPFNVWNLLRQKKLNAARDRQLEKHVPEIATADFDFGDSVRFLESLGCDRQQVVAGTIPAGSLNYAASFFDRLPQGRVRGLHIGNFVGISLAFFAAAVKKHHQESMVVAIDPNITHRHTRNPMEKVMALLKHFGLDDRCMVITGYSLEQSIANDGRDYLGNYIEDNAHSTEPSCCNQLPLLTSLSPHSFDFAVLDGNHEGAYLRRELDWIDRLLRPGGLLILDDVCASWFEIEEVYETLSGEHYEKLGTDGRIGIARRNP